MSQDVGAVTPVKSELDAEWFGSWMTSFAKQRVIKRCVSS